MNTRVLGGILVLMATAPFYSAIVAQDATARLSQSQLDSLYPLRSYELRARRAGLRMPMVAPAAPALQPPADTVSEVEPNDQIAQAQSLQFDVVLTGAIDQASDVDFFSVTLTAGQVVDIDIDAQSIGSAPDFRFELFDPSSAIIDVYDDYTPNVNLDPRAIFDVVQTGVYTIGVFSSAVDGGTTLGDYNLRIEEFPSGPGDPTILVSSNAGAPFGMAADNNGNLLTVDQLGGRILIVENTGTVVELLTDLGALLDIVEDGFGNLLVSGFNFTDLEPSIWVFNDQLSRTTFTTLISAIGPMTIGPDGDVWAADSQDKLIRRFTPRGALIESYALSPAGFDVFDIEFSPQGELHYSDGLDKVFKFVDGVAQEVISTRAFIDGIAFDEDGYLYVANGFEGRILLFDSNYQLVSDPFAARNLKGPINMVFDRAADGTTNSRLMAANNLGGLLPPLFDGAIVEMNPTGMRASGAHVGVTFRTVELDDDRQPPVFGMNYRAELETPLTGPVTWVITSGKLPRGLQLDGASGIIEGAPLETGRFEFDVRATGADGVGFGGLSLSVRFPEVEARLAADLLLEVPGLSLPQLEQFMDLQGNQNGVYDLGDFRRFIMRGPPASPPAMGAREDGQ